MTAPHDRFEALAGALALGEATADERRCFEAHARACARCSEDTAAATSLRTLVETVRDAESWRPAIRDTVFARIHKRHLGRSRFAMGALGWAFAVSVVLNAAIVSGVTGSLGRALRDHESSSDVVASHIRIERAPAVGVPTAVPLPFVPRAVRVREATPAPAHARVAANAHHAGRMSPSRLSVVARPAIAEKPAAVEAGVDDILAGLDVAAAHGLAAAPSARCKEDAAAALTPPEVCATPRPGEAP